MLFERAGAPPHAVKTAGAGVGTLAGFAKVIINAMFVSTFDTEPTFDDESIVVFVIFYIGCVLIAEFAYCLNLIFIKFFELFLGDLAALGFFPGLFFSLFLCDEAGFEQCLFHLLHGPKNSEFPGFVNKK